MTILFRNLKQSTRILSAEPVKAESCQQADDSLGDAFRDLSQRVILGRSQVGNGVQASTDPGQLACHLTQPAACGRADATCGAAWARASAWTR